MKTNTKSSITLPAKELALVEKLREQFKLRTEFVKPLGRVPRIILQEIKEKLQLLAEL